jgi:hypothetical protein
VLAMAAGSAQERNFRLGWSLWRRAHQAVAARCKKVCRATGEILRSREEPLEGHTGPKVSSVLPPEGAAPLTDEEWKIVEPLVPHKPPAGRPYHDHRTVLGGILWVARTGSSLARDARRVRQVGDRLQALRAVVGAGPLGAHPPSVGRRGVSRTGEGP